MSMNAKVEESRRSNLYVAAAKGDWRKAEEIFKNYPNSVRDKFSDEEYTALHVAVRAGKIDFAERLVSQYMTGDDLKQKDKKNRTAFYLAAMFGYTRLAKLMRQKKEELAMIRDENEDLPIQMAAMLGHKKMVDYLYRSTKDALMNDQDRIKLLIQLIDNDLYDVALMMVEDENKKGGLAILRVEGETALHALVRRPLRSNAERGLLSWIMMEKKKMHPKALQLVTLLWETIAKWDYGKITDLIEKPWSLILAAAKNGNIQFLSVLIETHPDLICKVDQQGYSLFHIAVQYRHESMFELVYNTLSIKSIIAAIKVGDKKNNILHLVAKLPPQNRLNIVSGAALQMMRELWWFEEVRQLMPPSYAEEENKDGKTARALFTESHKDLMKEGEQWMKKTAESCMIVATLITTIVFAAAFTLPGGVKEDTGAPNFVNKASFIVFAISNIISLVSSTYSILSFLAIITARYAEDDFAQALPQKLLSGLFALIISIIGMMVVFCMTLFIVFNDGTIWPPVLAIPLACIPIRMFIFEQSNLLLFDIVKLMNHLSNYHFQKANEEKQSEEEELKGRKPWMHLSNYNFLKRQSCSRLLQGKQSKKEEVKEKGKAVLYSEKEVV